MPAYIINQLNIADVENNSVFVLDRQFYPPHLLWSKQLWTAIVEHSVVKKAVRLAEKIDASMLGNIAVVIDEYSNSFLIYTLTIDKEHQSQGLATRLLAETAQNLYNLQESGWYVGIEHIRLSVEKDNIAAVSLYQKCGFKTMQPDGGKANKYYMQQSIENFYANMLTLSKENANRHRMLAS